jgi:hypothetical protein
VVFGEPVSFYGQSKGKFSMELGVRVQGFGAEALQKFPKSFPNFYAVF